MIYSAPIFQNRLVLVGRKGSGAETRSLEDLAGRTLAVVEGYAYGEELEKTNATLMAGGSEQANMLKLLNGEVDYVLVSELLLTYARRVQREKFEAVLEIGSEPQITRHIHFAVKREVPGAGKLVKALNNEIKAMIRDGSYHEIMGVGRLIADIDGDGKMEVVIVGDPAETLNPEEVYADFSGTPPQGEMARWYLVDKKLYASLDDIPADKRAKMKNPDRNIEFEFEGF